MIVDCDLLKCIICAVWYLDGDVCPVMDQPVLQVFRHQPVERSASLPPKSKSPYQGNESPGVEAEAALRLTRFSLQIISVRDLGPDQSLGVGAKVRSSVIAALLASLLASVCSCSRSSLQA